MQRDPRLRPLSSDHHHALVLARRASRAGERCGPTDPETMWRELVELFASELEPHFALEERLLLPALEEAGEVELVARARADHAALRACIGAAEAGDVCARLRTFGSLLTDHVRFEERRLLEVAQQRLSPGALDAIARATGST
jgi:hypothetical protein